MVQHLTVVDHPLVQHKLTLMRKKTTSTVEFRQLLKEISQFLAYEITRNLDMTTVNIETPIENFEAPTLEGKKLALKLGLLRRDLKKELFNEKLKDLKSLPKLVEKTLSTDNKIQAISNTFNEAKGSMFLGRGFSFPIALEGALKLKELSYIHAEGYPAGEMKHGPLALIEGMPVVVLAPRDNYYKKTISNMQEVIARGAKVLLVTNKSRDEVVSENIWEKIEVESANEDLLPFLLTIPLQKLAYYSALKKGFDIDKPRNLAKSVTVE